jgi:hypothetical protein
MHFHYRRKKPEITLFPENSRKTEIFPKLHSHVTGNVGMSQHAQGLMLSDKAFSPQLRSTCSEICGTLE